MGNKDYVEIDLREIFRIIWKKMWLIVLVTVMTTTLSGLYSKYLTTPIYRASTEILVNQIYSDEMEQVYYQRADIFTSLELVNTYSVIIKSPRVLDKVVEEYNLDITSSALSSQISVSPVTDSQVISISVTDLSHSQAVFIANAIAKTFQKEIKELMRVNNVHIMAEAKEEVNPRPISPQPFVNMVISFIVGVIIALGLIFILEYLDNTVKTEDDLEQLLGLPVLGTISKIDTKRENKLMKNHNRQLGGEEFEA